MSSRGASCPLLSDNGSPPLRQRLASSPPRSQPPLLPDPGLLSSPPRSRPHLLSSPPITSSCGASSPLLSDNSSPPLLSSPIPASSLASPPLLPDPGLLSSPSRSQPHLLSFPPITSSRDASSPLLSDKDSPPLLSFPIQASSLTSPPLLPDLGLLSSPPHDWHPLSPPLLSSPIPATQSLSLSSPFSPVPTPAAPLSTLPPSPSVAPPLRHPQLRGLTDRAPLLPLPYRTPRCASPFPRHPSCHAPAQETHPGPGHEGETYIY